MTWTEFIIDKLGNILTGLASFGAMLVSIINFRKIKEVHVQINSRMDKMLEMAGILGQAQGRAEAVTQAAEKLVEKVEKEKDKTEGAAPG